MHMGVVCGPRAFIYGFNLRRQWPVSADIADRGSWRLGVSAMGEKASKVGEEGAEGCAPPGLLGCPHVGISISGLEL